ncbi:MAG: RagB/SusD family nutrient uptake outer membrane protein [Bacteroidota bacterium]
MFSIKNLWLGSLMAVLLLTTSCEIQEIQNPNGPTIENLESGASAADLRLLSAGLESVMRRDLEFYVQTLSIVGREYWDLNGVDPRYTGELLGEQGAILDNNGFLTTRSWAARYRAVRNANLLITAVQNANASLTSEEENGYLGYAKTLQAYALLLVFNMQFENGARIDVADADNLGPVVNYNEGLSGIQALLSEAASDLSNGGGAFAFSLSSGFGDFSTPSEFRQFNRAIAARVAIYQDDKAAARTAIGESFMDLAGDLNLGAYHAYGLGGNDIPNPLFYVPNQDLFIVHPSWLNDAETGDLRVDAKTAPLDPTVLTVPVSLAGLSGDTQVQQFGSNIDQVPMIRNEELVLIYAEAQIGTDNDEAVAAINIVRSAAGLADYAGGTDDAALLEELLNQRRYSLFGEAHRWIDARRTGNLSQIPIDRPGDVVHTQFPIPVAENL